MKLNDPEDMVLRRNLTYDEIEYLLEKNLGAERKTFSSFLHGKQEVRELKDS